MIRGCFSCFAIYPPAEITERVDEDQTAIPATAAALIKSGVPDCRISGLPDQKFAFW